MSSSEGRNGLYMQGSNVLSSMRDRKLQEEDIWGVFKGRKSSNYSKIGTFNKQPLIKTGARMIPCSNGNSNNNIVHEPILVQHSAPINIPDWSKIYGSPRVDDGGGSGRGARSGWDHSDEEGEEDHDEGTMLPPHEWIARRLARSQMSAFSMCEGVGRTLKGRDLRRVRNAVLTKTGFLE